MEMGLAIFHYLCVFVLFSLLVGEFLILRLEVTGPGLKLMGRIDTLYGIFAGVVIVSGLLRVFLGEVPASFWISNPLFWTKMGLYLVVGLASVPPTVKYLKWAKAFAQDGQLPAPDAVKKTSVWVHVQMSLFLLIPVFAVLMKDR